MGKVDYKKDFKDLYVPKQSPVIVKVPTMQFVSIQGEGDPNKEEFAKETEALYAFSYSVKMSYKSSNIPDNYYEYTVFPLEGVWDLIDKSKPPTDKNNLRYNIMIRQPDFLNELLFERFINETKQKKKNSYIEQLKFESITEGLCCQMLHIGSYDLEVESFEKMEKFCKENGYTRSSKVHREIYLSDPRKVDASKLKTVLRFKVEKE